MESSVDRISKFQRYLSYPFIQWLYRFLNAQSLSLRSDTSGDAPWGHPVRSYPLCYYYQLLGCTEAPQGHESSMLGKRRRKSLWMIWVGKKTILGAASQSRERETEDGRSLFVLWKFLWHARAEQCDRMKLIWSRSRTLGILWSNISRRTKDNHVTGVVLNCFYPQAIASDPAKSCTSEISVIPVFHSAQEAVTSVRLRPLCRQMRVAVDSNEGWEPFEWWWKRAIKGENCHQWEHGVV